MFVWEKRKRIDKCLKENLVRLSKVKRYDTARCALHGMYVEHCLTRWSFGFDSDGGRRGVTLAAVCVTFSHVNVHACNAWWLRRGTFLV